MQAIETIKTGSADDQAVALLPSCRLKLGNLFQSDGEVEHGHLGDASHRHRNELSGNKFREQHVRSIDI